MNETLSVVLPVHNAEATLPSQVHDLLDSLSGWQEPIEIVIVDDGSTDDTSDCADELARRYPQLRVLRNRRRQGKYTAIRQGLKLTSGRIVIVHDDSSPFRGLPRDLS
ncbi:MAG: glycosyltransferase [Pirellulales bacterium]